MDTILDALQEGRLFELPEPDKAHALQFLAHIIEAFPQIPPGMDIVGNVTAREEAMNTSFGMGWACPHARVDFEEDLMCVVGWSPTGIDYGAPDGNTVSIIVMYLVPSNQRNHYLREISILVKALKASSDMARLQSVRSLNDARNFLLDLIAASKETGGPDARARMIRLQAKTAQIERAQLDLANILIEPISIIAGPGMQPIILTHNPDLLTWAESSPGLADRLDAEGSYRNGQWRLIRKSSTAYLGNRILHDCIALAPPPSASGNSPKG